MKNNQCNMVTNFRPYSIIHISLTRNPSVVALYTSSKYVLICGFHSVDLQFQERVVLFLNQLESNVGLQVKIF